MIRSPFRPHRSQTGLAALAALVVLMTVGCADKHIGRRCKISADGGTMPMGATKAAVNALALECPSRLCILPAQQVTTDTQALCTDECSSDDDCADGEKRVAESSPDFSTDFRCTTNFLCRTAFADLLDTPLACKKVCICGDFVKDKKNDVKPLSCP